MYPLFYHASATPEIYNLSLHDALPICRAIDEADCRGAGRTGQKCRGQCPERRQICDRAEPDQRERYDEQRVRMRSKRSEEHTSELQSHSDLVCRLLLEKKK